MTEKELMKIASSRPPLTDEEISDDLTEEDINEMCEEAWLRFTSFSGNMTLSDCLKSQND